MIWYLVETEIDSKSAFLLRIHLSSLRLKPMIRLSMEIRHESGSLTGN